MLQLETLTGGGNPSHEVHVTSCPQLHLRLADKWRPPTEKSRAMRIRDFLQAGDIVGGQIYLAMSLTEGNAPTVNVTFWILGNVFVSKGILSAFLISTRSATLIPPDRIGSAKRTPIFPVCHSSLREAAR